MRHLTCRTRARQVAGFTLVEVVVAMALLAFLAMASGTFFGDYMSNSRLREEGNSLYAILLASQSEAIKRNGQVRVAVTSTRVDVVNVPTNAVLRSHVFNHGVRASAAVDVTLGSDGRPTPFGTAASIDLTMSGMTCSSDLRCPGLRVDGGGSVRLCANQQVNCS